MEHVQVLHSLSKLFSPSTFREVIVDGNTDYLQKKLNKHKSLLGITSTTTNHDVLKAVYTLMNKNYRSEYLYKNYLFNKLVEDKKLSETTILNEIRIGSSIADTVFINGQPVLYEIKTELDTPQKLISQLDDYQKAIAKITVVTHESNYYKYYQVLKGTDIGLIYLSSKNNFITSKETVFNSTYLDHVVLFKLLRKPEYSLIIENFFGNIPEVPNTLFYKSCLNLVKQIPVEEFYKHVFAQLRLRKPHVNQLLLSRKTPRELKYLCYSLDFKASHYQSLHNFLQSPFNC